MRTPQARKNTASVSAVGLIAVMPKARSTAVRTWASARASSGSITVRERISTCCATRVVTLHLPLEGLDRRDDLALPRHDGEHVAR